MTMFYSAGYKCPNAVAFRANSGLEIAYNGSSGAHVPSDHAGARKTSTQDHYTSDTGPRSACEISPSLSEVQSWNRLTLNKIKRWELMGIDCYDDRQVTAARAASGLVPLTSKEMATLRSQGRDPEKAFVPELGDVDGRCLNLENVDANTAQERISAWDEYAYKNRLPGTSEKEIFAGESRLGTPPIDKVFIGWSKTSNEYFKTHDWK